MTEDNESDDNLAQWYFEVTIEDFPGASEAYNWVIHLMDSGAEVLAGRERCDPTKVLKGICDRFNESEVIRHPRTYVFGAGPAHHIGHEYALPEIQSIADIKKALDSAGSDDARRRILRWTQQYCADNGLHDA